MLNKISFFRVALIRKYRIRTRRLGTIACIIVVALVFVDLLYFRKESHRQKFSGNSGSKLLVALEDFLFAANQIHFPVLLIDEEILKRIYEADGDISNTSECLAFCNSNSTFVSFATKIHSWEGVFEPFHDKFMIISLPIKDDTETIKRLETVDNSHYLFIHGRTEVTIHLVFFFKFMGDYYFHGRIDMNLLDIDKTLTYSISYGATHAGVYNRRDLDSRRVFLDTLHIRIPININQFLRAKNESHFLPCNMSLVDKFERMYGERKFENETDKTFRKVARNILQTISVALHYHGVPFWISSGTCLGWFRQCDLIVYSKDVDIGIFIKDYDPTLLDIIENSGLTLIQFFGKESDSLELSYTNGHIKLDIFFFYEEDDHMWNGGVQARTGQKFKYLFKKFHLCWTIFLELVLRVPCETEQYVTDNYGPNWFQPVKDWDWKKSPANVIENGQWPKSEWEDVIQLL